MIQKYQQQKTNELKSEAKINHRDPERGLAFFLSFFLFFFCLLMGVGTPSSLGWREVARLTSALLLLWRQRILLQPWAHAYESSRDDVASGSAQSRDLINIDKLRFRWETRNNGSSKRSIVTWFT